MFKNLIFYSIVSVAMFYLLLTSPSKVDEVCSDAAAVASKITDVVSSKVSITDGEEADLTQSTPGTEASTDRALIDQEMNTTQRSRRDEIMENATDIFDDSDFPEIHIAENGDSVGGGGEHAARLESVREQMDKIYLQNNFGR